MLRVTLLVLLILMMSKVWSQPKSPRLENPAALLKEIQQDEEEGRLSDKKLIKKYKKVALACSAESHEYEKLQAWYNVMTLSTQDYKNKAQMMEAAKACYLLLKPKMLKRFTFPSSEKGEFYKEAIRLSSNILAWYTQEETNDHTALTEVEEVITLGCQYIEGPQHYFMLDTHVRILLKLQKKEEAYNIVYRCLQEDKDFSDFDDIKRNKEYIQWRNSHYPEKPPRFSPDELSFLKKAKRIHQKLLIQTKGDEKLSPPLAAVGLQAEIMKLSEAKKKYGFTGDFHQEEDHFIVVIPGDLKADTTVNGSWIEKLIGGLQSTEYLYGVLITGHLIVDGDLLDDDGFQLRVMKDLWCDFLHSYNGGIEIGGDAHVTYGIYGEYNDGYLHVNGKVYTPYIVADDHDMPREATGDLIYIEGGNGTFKHDILVGTITGSGLAWDWEYFDDSSKLFVEEVWDEEDGFSVVQFFKQIRDGKNPFRPLE